jgi:hypothetical protein
MAVWTAKMGKKCGTVKNGGSVMVTFHPRDRHFLVELLVFQSEALFLAWYSTRVQS